jgi:hypothetical protein
MRTLIRWAARLYPASWRNRYAAEFDALLDDLAPCLGDLCDVLVDVFRVRATASMDACLMLAAAAPVYFRRPVVVSLTAHALILSLILLASWFYVAPMPVRVAAAPLPPPVPDPPPQITDDRVFPRASTAYSSLPLRMPSPGEDALYVQVDKGVGINFLSLPDIGATYRQGNMERRVWPGQALEGFIVRRVLPEFPRGAKTQSAVSVYVEYLITLNGSVKVLRTSGPAPFTTAAQSAIEKWAYHPLWFEDHPCEVISRVEVKFDNDYAG